MNDNDTSNTSNEQTADTSLQATTTPKKRRLTSKEIGYVTAIASGMTRRDAVKASYDVKDDISRHTLDNMASAIEKRPEVLNILLKHEQEAQETVADVMRYSRELGATGSKEGAQYARVAVDSGNSILDRLHGKATTVVEAHSTAVSFTIDLSGMGDDGSTVYDIIDGESTPV